jgi:hypothetical protein
MTAALLRGGRSVFHLLIKVQVTTKTLRDSIVTAPAFSKGDISQKLRAP